MPPETRATTRVPGGNAILPAMSPAGAPDVEPSASSVESKGGKINSPKMAVPGIGWLAYCVDPEGNTFGLLQPDAEAK